MKLCDTMKMPQQIGRPAQLRSSRSHFIFQIQFEVKRDGDVPSSGRLTFIDLAGSEARDVAKNKKQEQEGRNIRNSLNALKTYLLDRAKGNSSSVSFRSSKLSFMMKGVLKQDAKVLVIANISPCTDSFSQTKEALDFVKNIAKLKNFQKRLITCQYNENIESQLQEMRLLLSSMTYFLVIKSKLLVV